MRYLFLLSILFSTSTYWSQTFIAKYVNLQAQLILSLGTHQTALGIQLKGGVNYQFVQLNAHSRVTYNLFNLGHRKKYVECRNGLGLAFYTKDTLQLNTMNYWGIANQLSPRTYGIGYGYLWYYDKLGTSQRSGVWSFNTLYFNCNFENDIFAGQGKDRFRSGHLQFGYRTNYGDFSAGIQIWTGETRQAPWIKDSTSYMPNGYRDLSLLPFGKTSHGIVYVGYSNTLSFNQIVAGRIGWDSEQNRHLFQNKLSHDLVLMPKSMKRHTPHYPRLGVGGMPVFSRKDVRKTKVYGQLIGNGLDLY